MKKLGRLQMMRGQEEKFGAVLKGMTNLDWQNFKYAMGGLVIGEHTKEFIKKRQAGKIFLIAFILI